MIKPMLYCGRSPVENKPFIIEQWKPIDQSIHKNADGSIWISNFGRAYSTIKRCIIPAYPNKDGYLNIFINSSSTILLHRAVMLAFAPIDHPELYDVNHNDGDKTNCCIYNLCWATRGENLKFAYLNGLRIAAKGTDHYRSKLTADQADLIGKLLSEEELTIAQISRLIGCSYQIICHIAHGHTYNDIYMKYKLYERHHRGRGKRSTTIES